MINVIVLVINVIVSIFIATWVSRQGKIFDSDISQLNAVKNTLVEFGNRVHYIASERKMKPGRDLIDECRKANMAENEIGIVLSEENQNKEALRQQMRRLLYASCRLNSDFNEREFVVASDQSNSETDIV